MAAWRRVPGGTGSPYCHYGREWECFVDGREPAAGAPLAAVAASTTAACQAACASSGACEWWVLRQAKSDPSSAAAAAAPACELFGTSAAGAKDCDGCAMGPKVCPGMAGRPQAERAMTAATVAALLAGEGEPTAPAWAADGAEDVLEKMARLDNAGYFNGRPAP